MTEEWDAPTNSELAKRVDELGTLTADLQEQLLKRLEYLSEKIQTIQQDLAQLRESHQSLSALVYQLGKGL